MARLALWAVPAGLVGARLYSVVTSWQADTGGRWYRAFEIWQGGLGIWGGVAAGVAVGLIAARHYRLDWRTAIDSAAPSLALAQAIGRWGNYLPRTIRKPQPAAVGGQDRPPRPLQLRHRLRCLPARDHHLPAHVPLRVPVGPGLRGADHPGRTTPTDPKGYLFFVYAALYSVGRFFTEHLRSMKPTATSACDSTTGPASRSSPRRSSSSWPEVGLARACRPPDLLCSRPPNRASPPSETTKLGSL